MLFHFLYPLSEESIVFNVFRYITFRSFAAFIIATLVSIFWGKRFIAFMKKKQFGQVIRDDGPQSHKKKAGTPTFGGVFIIGSISMAMLFCGNFSSIPFMAGLFVMLSYFGLGGLDDYLKVLKKDPKGVSPKAKLVWQFITAFIVVAYLVKSGAMSTELYIPFVKGSILDLGLLGYMAFGSLVIVGTSNAVNLTDGLDGLAIGPIIVSSAAMGLLSYLAGHVELANYLLIPYVDGGGEMVVLVASVIGAGVGFLWYNSYPAQIFMGDVGSLSLGGLLGVTALVTKNEFLFCLIGGVFVVEALSVILQVGSYKLRKKRIFKMAPLHHHFELLGWSEPKVIVRFWIVSIILAILSLATLKLR